MEDMKLIIGRHMIRKYPKIWHNITIQKTLLLLWQQKKNLI